MYYNNKVALQHMNQILGTTFLSEALVQTTGTHVKGCSHQAEVAQSQTEGRMPRRSQISDSDCGRRKTNGKYWHFSIRQTLRKSPAW